MAFIVFHVGTGTYFDLEDNVEIAFVARGDEDAFTEDMEAGITPVESENTIDVLDGEDVAGLINAALAFLRKSGQ